MKSMQIDEVPTAPRSPWQNPYAERIIGSIRRECLNHLIVLNEVHLKRILTLYFDYYHDVSPTSVAESQLADATRSRATVPGQGRFYSAGRRPASSVLPRRVIVNLLSACLVYCYRSARAGDCHQSARL